MDACAHTSYLFIRGSVVKQGYSRAYSDEDVASKRQEVNDILSDHLMSHQVLHVGTTLGGQWYRGNK